jgi:hypothetical protein
LLRNHFIVCIVDVLHRTLVITTAVALMSEQSEQTKTLPKAEGLPLLFHVMLLPLLLLAPHAAFGAVTGATLSTKPS